MHKKIILTLIFLFLSSCGYQPINALNSKTNFNLNVTKLNGDQNINKNLQLILMQFSNQNSNEIVNVEINSIYEKTIIGKDSTGSATNFNIELRNNFLVEIKNIKKEIMIKNNFKIKKLSDSFEQDNYEKTIKDTLIRNNVQELIKEISTLK